MSIASNGIKIEQNVGDNEQLLSNNQGDRFGAGSLQQDESVTSHKHAKSGNDNASEDYERISENVVIDKN